MLTRNTYVVIGLVGCVVVLLLLIAVMLCMQRPQTKGYRPVGGGGGALTSERPMFKEPAYESRPMYDDVAYLE